MAAKVVTEEPTHAYEMPCNGCGRTLRFTQADTRLNGDKDYSYLDCPKCTEANPVGGVLVKVGFRDIRRVTLEQERHCACCSKRQPPKS